MNAIPEIRPQGLPLVGRPFLSPLGETPSADMMAQTPPPVKKSPLLALFLVALVDMLGLGIVIPLFAPLVVGPDSIVPWLGDAGQKVALGVLLAAYPLAQFFGAPILGALADKRGRKPVLEISLAGSLLGWVAFCAGVALRDPWILLAGRAVSGFTGGNMAVVYSSVADVSRPEDRARNYGLIGLAFGVGFVFGPFLGGTLSEIPFFGLEKVTPFAATAALTLANMAFVRFAFQETLREKVAHRIHPFSGFVSLWNAFRDRNLGGILLVMLLYACGFTFFTQFFQVFLQEKFSFGERAVGLLFGYTGLWIGVSQGLLVKPATKRLGHVGTLRWAVPVSGLAVLALLLVPRAWQLYAALPFLALANGLANPNFSAATSERAGGRQGEIFGINQAVQAFSQSVPPLLSGFLATFWTGMPMAVAVALMLAAGVALLFFRDLPARPGAAEPEPAFPA